MPWQVPNKGEGDSNLQSILFRQYLQVLQAGISGQDCVLSGCAVTGGSDMTPEVAKGAVLSNGVLYAVAAGTATITTADATNPRIDLIVVNSSGSIAVRTGTAAAAPEPPELTANDVCLAAVYVPATDTTIGTSQITDLRVIRGNGPIVIFRQTTADTINTTSAAIEILNRAGSGVTIPDGLFLAGRVLRVRIGGHILYNSGTPTARIAIAYGGTTMFSDISAASTGDADRAPFDLFFDIIAQGNSDQSLIGTLGMGLIAAKTAPTTGRGDAWSTANNVNPVNGDAAVNSDTGNRVLSVQFTFSVSNAANEITIEGATVELL